MAVTELDLISVVIPAYNCEATLEAAVRSVLEQTWGSFEVLIIDDGSRDGTPEVIRELERMDRRVRGFRMEKNDGVSAARNLGIREASGKWLFTLDDDDTLEPGTLERLFGRVTEDASDTCIGGIAFVFPDGKREEYAPSENAVFEKDAFLKGPFPVLYDRHLISTHSNKLYDLPLIREHGIFYREELQVNEDIDFCLRYLAACRRISTDTGVYLDYNQHAAGESLITTFRENGVEGALRNYSALEALYAGFTDTPAYRHMLVRMFEHVCSFAGLMYYRSDYGTEKRREVLRRLSEDARFRKLLAALPPSELKNRAAAFLLRLRFTGVYDALCRILYRDLKKRGA